MRSCTSAEADGESLGRYQGLGRPAAHALFFWLGPLMTYVLEEMDACTAAAWRA